MSTSIKRSRAVKEPSKRGAKKKFPVVAIITPDGIEGSLQTRDSTRKPLIVHLPIQSKSVSFSDNMLCYDPAPPPQYIEPYDKGSTNVFLSSSENVINELFVNKNENISSPVVATKIEPQIIVESKSDRIYKNEQLLVQFKNSNETRTLPDRSESACFWCCHTFTESPVVLPVKDVGKYIQVFGNFCSPECAVSYLFDIRQDFHTRWEQFSLLNRVYASGCDSCNPIRPAPPRDVLKMFGGLIEIEEFRNINKKGRVRIDVHVPPMVSLLSSMDTKPIDFYDVNLTKDAMETAKERLQKVELTLKLQRTKPLKAWESTLDACMNLRIHTQM